MHLDMANRIWNEHFCFINWQSLWGGLKTWMDYSAVRTGRKESSSSLWTDVFPWSNGETAAVGWVRFPSFQIPNLAFRYDQSFPVCSIKPSLEAALVLGLLLLNTIALCSWLITEDVKPKATRGQTRPYIYGTAMFKRSHPVMTIRCKPRYSPLKATPEHRANFYQLYTITQ